VYPLATDEHVLVLVAAVRSLAQELAFEPKPLVELDIVVREIGSNALKHGGGGHASVRAIARFEGACPDRDAVQSGRSRTEGIEVVVTDEGPGIPDVAAALVDGFSTRHSLGLGLGAARRLSDRFTIETAAGVGTRVAIVKWRARVG
jgi:serine/threonine-protein kinase RsbT